MSFLPDDYEVPNSANNYMKLVKGENTFRILSSALIGWEAWLEEDNKSQPVRFLMNEKPTDLSKYKDKQLRHFWAFVVWNYNESRIQILMLTQKTIQAAIKALVSNEKWGDPKGYDISITRSGDGFDTEYNVMPSPHSPTSTEALEASAEQKIDLNKLLTNDDPFVSNEEFINSYEENQMDVA